MYDNPRPDLKLKSCPFCNDTHIELRTNAPRSWFCAMCDACGAQVMDDSYTTVAARWNRRPRENGRTVRLKRNK